MNDITDAGDTTDAGGPEDPTPPDAARVLDPAEAELGDELRSIRATGEDEWADSEDPSAPR
jgi:hypothetical protein